MMKTKFLIMGLALTLIASCGPLEKRPREDYSSELYYIRDSNPLNSILMKSLKEKKPIRIVENDVTGNLTIRFMDSSEIRMGKTTILGKTRVLEGVIVEFTGMHDRYDRVYRLKYLWAINN